MSGPIPLREYVVSGMVEAETVNALLPFGEPMITEDPREAAPGKRWYRAWVRLRAGGRTFGRWDFSPQFTAEHLLGKLRGAK